MAPKLDSNCFQVGARELCLKGASNEDNDSKLKKVDNQVCCESCCVGLNEAARRNDIRITYLRRLRERS